MKRMIMMGLLLLVLISLSACLAGPNRLEKTPDAEGEVAGFFMGLWHGMLTPITFIISVFSSSIRFYEVHNSGLWYNLGYVIGAGLFLSGGILGSKKNRK